MRQVHRPALPAMAQSYLNRRSLATTAENVESAWKTARQTQRMKAVLGVLQQMAGARERCMYCVDSHGSDIEHFWPKSAYPTCAFVWSNMLLCCTECGRLKGDQFPLSQTGQPSLVDPSAEDPWDHLDFDPDTGNLTARYDIASGAPSAKGSARCRCSSWTGAKPWPRAIEEPSCDSLLAYVKPCRLTQSTPKTSPPPYCKPMTMG